MELHKNSPKRIIFPGAVYYIVIKTQDNYPYFKETIFCDSFIEDLKICKELKTFKLYGFSIIYDHVNLLIGPGAKYDISQISKSLKRNVSRNVNIIAGYTKSFSVSRVEASALHVGDTSLCRLRGRDEREYPAKKINELKARFAIVYSNTNPYPKFQWQKSFYDHIIRFHDNIVRQEKDWDFHYNYTVYNHIKHGLPENWKYTSLKFPELITQ